MIAETWDEIPLDIFKTPALQKLAMRLNALGSLFYFSKYVLGRDQLSPTLHGYLCRQFESDHIHVAIEFPRDHLKTTCGSESASMWWALPFTEVDEANMRKIGYGDEWIRYMKRVHNPSTRTLIASEVIGNARKIGVRIDGHYRNNAVFRKLFPEIIPSSLRSLNTAEGKKKKSRWNQDSMTHKRPPGPTEGEGTYDFIGVKGALQSRHYDRIIEDDLVGEKAVYSESVMETTIEWHRKLPGALTHRDDNPDLTGDQIIIGNRWSHKDLNSWIRENEPHYQFHNHSAEGGCCDMHPQAGVPIWPEMFSMSKLAVIRQTEGSYNYSAQYLNNPVDPEACRFKESWLPRFNFEASEFRDNAVVDTIRHETVNGVAIPDLSMRLLNRVAILDVNHSGQAGRCRHAIIVAGYTQRTQTESPRVYLLESWAESCTFDKMIDKLIGPKGLALKWHCHYLYVETVAGQDGWYYLFQQKMRNLGLEAGFTVRKLKVDRGAGAKQRRIEGMEAMYENGMVWARRQGGGVNDFLHEYSRYPNGSTVDLLDAFGYLPQVMEGGSIPIQKQIIRQEAIKRQQAIQSLGVCGY